MNEIIVVVREELHFGKGKMAKENEQGGHHIAISYTVHFFTVTIIISEHRIKLLC